MSRNIVETALGAVVLAVAVAFILFTYTVTRGRIGHSYELTAKFDHIDGIQTGGDIRLSGIKVGSIVSQVLDPKTFQAILKLRVDDTVKLPVDTVASITSSGLLGDNYVQLVPGGDDKTIEAGGTLTYTQSPISLQSLLGQAVFSATGGGGAKAAPAPEGGTPSPSTPSSTGPSPTPSSSAPSPTPSKAPGH